MTRISVSTRALSDGGRRVQGFGRQSGERADAVKSVLAHLDMDFKGRSRYDEIARATGNDLSVQAQRLQQHGAYLVAAAAKYEQAEERVLGSSRGFDGRYRDRATGPSVASAFKSLWRGLTDGLAGIDFESLHQAWDGVSKGFSYFKTAAKLSVQLLTLTNLISLGTADWACRVGLGGLKAAGTIVSGVSAVFDGVEEFITSPGSMARRVSNVAVVGAASFLGGIGGAALGGVVGSAIGGAIGSVFPGPGTAIGAFIGGKVGAYFGQQIGSEVAKRLVNAEVGGASVKSMIGDMAEGKSPRLPTSIQLGPATGGGYSNSSGTGGAGYSGGGGGGGGVGWR